MCFSYNLPSSLGRAASKAHCASARQPILPLPLAEGRQAAPRLASPIHLSADAVVDVASDSESAYICGKYSPLFVLFFNSIIISICRRLRRYRL